MLTQYTINPFGTSLRQIVREMERRFFKEQQILEVMRVFVAIVFTKYYKSQQAMKVKMESNSDMDQYHNDKDVL